MTPDFALLRRLVHAPREIVRVDGMRHTDFTSLGFASAAVPGLTGPAPEALAEKCAAVAQYTLAFLDAHMRGNQRANGLPAAPAAAWLTVERWPAEPQVQQQNGMMIREPPQRIIEIAEHLARAGIPTPPEIVRQLVQTAEARRQRRQGTQRSIGPFMIYEPVFFPPERACELIVSNNLSFRLKAEATRARD